MTWSVEYTDAFGTWWQSLSEDEQVELDASVQLLEEFGPSLGRPHCDTIQGTKAYQYEGTTYPMPGATSENLFCL
ncbi:MAG: type II toxin-antitoxin system RelE/ParE family toxin [Candidatus Electrothrix sp. Rat3]|nr:type II toxin-antitoxin system RelE/ParE family toxin [Candidatus Electrothrix rattekaaiensis]